MLSRTSMDRLLNKIKSSALKDGKIEAIHGLLEQHKNLFVGEIMQIGAVILKIFSRVQWPPLIL